MMKARFCLCFAAILVAASLAAAARPVYRLTLSGTINPISRDLVKRAIREAEDGDAAILVIELNTPGGLADAMRDIVIAEFDAQVPVVVFVSPAGARAASAGALITLAADIAAMAPGTNIGAATPVDLLGGGEEESAAIDKAVNDAAAFARSVAEQRGRNVEWAEAAVREASSLSASEALELGVIDLLADDFDDLLQRLEGRSVDGGEALRVVGADVRTVRPSLRERLLDYLANPNIVYILFLLGLYGLIYEFFQPGVGFGLAAGGICLALALFGLQVLPINIVGVALILFGVGLMILDAFTPTNGILTFGGVIALLAGSFSLFDIQDPAIGLSWVTVVAMVGAVTLLSLFVVSKGLLAQRRRPATGLSALVGLPGRAMSELAPEGQVRVRGETWSAITQDNDVPLGERIRVVRVEGRRLVVAREHPPRRGSGGEPGERG
ncbi:MAG: nodulation protein NfeD [Candidatus Bipolaricaulota bacterium]|nr:MAG: nodulation protein NfeD [Candidatus Bipolaricaulota bacterium]